MTLKIIGIIFIVSSCSTYGYSLKYKHTARVRELENFTLCLDILIKEITINSNNLCDSFLLVLNYAGDYNSLIFKRIIDLYNTSDGETLSAIWDLALNEFAISEKIYTKNDIVILKRFGTLLGCGDMLMQKENIDNIKQLLNQNINEAKSENAKVSNMAKISIYIGIIISVILL